MSLRTRIKGFTAWVNLRLMPYNQLLNNVLMDLLTGTHIKFLTESFTGRDLKRLETMDDLSQQQKQTRVEWMMEELKSCNIIPEDVHLDSRHFAMRSADHVFDLLWRLIGHDIWFLWERAEYLQHEDMNVLIQVPFKWTPEPPPPKKKKSSKKPKKSLLSGFGAPSTISEQAEDDEVEEKWIKYPHADYVKNFKKKKKENLPTPDECILEMVNYQLKTTRDGKNLFCYSLDDFVDSRVLCALVNSFVPNTFTSDLLLNDRWTINLALRTAEKMFYAETPFNSEDLVEADSMAVCAYFTFFLMVAYKYRQATAVVNRVEYFNMLIRECNHELEKFPPVISNMQELKKRKEIKVELDKHRQVLENIQKNFDVDYCRKWIKHVQQVQSELRHEIKEKMKNRFDVVEIPRNISINDFCLAAVINLSLTNGSGFYLSSNKETLNDGRRLILRHKETKEFIDDFTSKSKASVRQVLNLPDINVIEINPASYPDYEFFFEAPSRNKQLKTGTLFLYQVFPGNTATWQRLFIKSARENEYETLEKMIVFFKEHPAFISSRESKTGNTALHWACRLGHFEIVRLLLENGANIDLKNNFKSTPISLAIEGLHRRLCQYLIEWGCDVHCKNVKNQSPFETTKNEEFKRLLIDTYEHYSDIVPKIMGGDMEMLNQCIRHHVSEIQPFVCLRSRCINGSTLLHTACYYGNVAAVKELLSLRVDVNLLDYKGASPIHRVKSPEIMQILIEAGANIDAQDSEGNTALHVKCYGETNASSELTCIEMLLNKGASMTIQNSRGLLPIHCCAMQGRVDVMRLMMRFDRNSSIAMALNKEDQKQPPSLLHLAIANDFIQCAAWLLANSFRFKEREPDILMRRILTEQLKLNKRTEAVKFLLENGADASPKYPGGNTALHYAAGLSGNTEALELILQYGAEVDAVNDEGNTPLFSATQANNQFAACILTEKGANVRHKNNLGLTAFDQILDFEEWINCGYFSDEIKARLKAYNLKHARDLIRAISKKVKPGSLQMRHDITRSAYSMRSVDATSSNYSFSAGPSSRFLPPLKSVAPTGYIMY
ncbi:hypothetical protein CHS0354_034226 [Potamilus streckersoni]|uniref:Calponin-homology (CH) domain-containing protein n=1 Tax=Potamilus streckersoni TaxID=2493646 RepID=A0AAE0T2W4_9BIVA|nr:hypothetical protein CHS0354_034226 [Potamilus streckersoni]